MDLVTLQNHLVGKGNPLTLSAGDANLPAEFRAFLGTVPNEQVTLSAGPNGIMLANGVLTISGTSSDAWPVQGLNDVRATLSAITITLTDQGNAPLIAGVAEATLPIGGTVTAPVTISSLQQAGSPWQVKLAGDPTGVTPLQLLLLGKWGRLPFAVPDNLDVLSRAVTVARDEFQITFYPNTTNQMVYTFGLTVPAAKWEALPGIVTFDGIDIDAVVMTSSTSVSLTGHIVIDKVGVDVGVSLSARPNWTAVVKPTPGGSFPGVAALAAWVGGSDNALAADTGSGFQAMNFSTSDFDAKLTAVTLGFNWKKPALNYLEVVSLLTVGGVQLDVVLRLPDLTLAGSLHDGRPVKVKDVLASFGLATAGVPDDLSVVAVNFAAALRVGSYSAGMTVDNVWQIGPVQFQEVSATVFYDEGEFAGQFDCKLDIGTAAQLDLRAEYDATTGWTFEGGTEPGTSITIGNVIAELADTFGITHLPQPIQSLTLTNLIVSYQTGTGKFSYACEGDFTVADTPVKMIVTIAVSPTQAGDASRSGTVTGSKGYSATVTGQVTVSSLEFDLVFDTQSTGRNVFVADYLETGPPASKSLRDLVAGVSSAAAALIPAGLDVDLKEVKFIFYQDTASQDPPGQKQWAFGLGLGLSIGLSEIPIVGSKLPAGVALALDDLQVTYSSQNLKPPQVGVVNPLLPAGLRPLPAAGLNAGINFSGVLQLGGVSVPLGLPVPGDHLAPSGPPPAGPTAAAAAPPASPDTGTWVTVQKQFGIFLFKRIGAQYQNNVLSFALDADVSLGPLTFSMDGLSVGSPLTRFTPVFGLNGLGLSFKKPPLEIGGQFLKTVEPGTAPPVATDGAAPADQAKKTEDPSTDRPITSYFGYVAVQAATFGFTALGGWSPDAHPASFFLYAKIDVPLGGPPFFFVTGLAAGFGINRALKLPTIDGLPGYPLLPHHAPPPAETPAQTLTQVVPVLSEYFRDAPGEYWVAAGVQFTSFEMIDAFALVTVSFGVDFQLAVLGSCAMTFPKGDPYPVAYVEVDLLASLTPATGLLAVDGKLSPASFLYGGFCKLTGGFAFHVWFAGPHAGDFVVTLGGYHPAFPKPPHYPAVPRLGIAFGLGPFQVTGQAYFALTPAMMMAGVNMSAVWHSGSIKAWLDAGVDFLIAWAPFHYEADAYITVGCSVNLGLLTLDVHVGADLTVWGPPFGGKAHVDLDVVAFTIEFGAPAADPLPVGWEAFKSGFLPKDSTSAPAPAPVAAEMMQAAPVPLGMMRAAAPADPPPTNIVKASVQGGLLRSAAPTFDWILDPDDFDIRTASAIPANNGEWGLAGSGVAVIPDTVASYNVGTVDAAQGPYLTLPAEPHTYSATQVWNPTLSIGPMNQNNVQSYHTVRLTRDGVPVTAVSVQPVIAPSNTALWAAGKKTKAPNDPAIVPYTLTGFRITPIPRVPDQVNAVPINDLLFAAGYATGFSYPAAAVDPNYTVVGTTDAQGALTIGVSGGYTGSIHNQGYVLAALADPWVAGRRTGILNDLAGHGFTTLPADPVDISVLATRTALTDWPAVALLGQKVST